MKDIFIDETRKAEGLALLEEASRVLLTFNPSFTVPAIQEWLSNTLLVREDDVHIMLQTVMEGKLTEIDDFVRTIGPLCSHPGFNIRVYTFILCTPFSEDISRRSSLLFILLLKYFGGKY